jgi:hypothetical protein
VALAGALAIEPKVLLLDAKVRQGLWRWLRRLDDTVHIISILVTHDQEEALEVADRVVVMNQARIEQTGTPEEVFHHPASEFVMDFTGSVNLFHERIESGKAVFGPLVLEHSGSGAVEGQGRKTSAGVGACLWSEPPACHAAIPGGILSAGRCPQESGHSRPEAHSTGANQGVSPTIGVFHEIPRAAGPPQQTGRSAPLGTPYSGKPTAIRRLLT